MSTSDTDTAYMAAGVVDVPSHDASIQLTSESLKTMQWWAALITVVVPTLATGLALWLAFNSGVSPIAIVAWAAMHVATMVGITVGFHRFCAHRAFDAEPVAGTALVILGSMAAQGPMIHWVSNHRRHHQFSDKERDVHSPHIYGGSSYQRMRGFWHSHIGWMFGGDVTNPMRYSRDLLKQRGLMRINRLYPLWVLLGLLAPGLIVGLATRSWEIGLQTLLWAGFVRIFTVHHATWSINSITHLWGARPFKSNDHSVNVAWLAIPSAGEAWHNCHHAFPGSARFGLAWWQFDIGYVVIWTLERLRLASGVNRPSIAAMNKARTRSHQQQEATQ